MPIIFIAGATIDATTAWLTAVLKAFLFIFSLNTMPVSGSWLNGDVSDNPSTCPQSDINHRRVAVSGI